MLEGRGVVWAVEHKDPVGETVEVYVTAGNYWRVSAILNADYIVT